MYVFNTCILSDLPIQHEDEVYVLFIIEPDSNPYLENSWAPISPLMPGYYTEVNYDTTPVMTAGYEVFENKILLAHLNKKMGTDLSWEQIKGLNRYNKLYIPQGERIFNHEYLKVKELLRINNLICKIGVLQSGLATISFETEENIREVLHKEYYLIPYENHITLIPKEDIEKVEPYRTSLQIKIVGLRKDVVDSLMPETDRDYEQARILNEYRKEKIISNLAFERDIWRYEGLEDIIWRTSFSYAAEQHLVPQIRATDNITELVSWIRLSRLIALTTELRRGIRPPIEHASSRSPEHMKTISKYHKECGKRRKYVY